MGYGMAGMGVARRTILGLAEMQEEVSALKARVRTCG